MTKKIFFILTITLSILCFSCNKPNKDTEYASGNKPTSIQTFKSINDIKGLSCIILDDYDFNEMIRFKMGSDFQETGAACSEIRKGNFVTRNLDWFQYDQATFLMAVGHTDKHLASLTVCSLENSFTHDFDCTGISATEANHLMGCTTDGMNEMGVYIGINVVPFGQMSTNGGNGTINYRPKKGENCNKPQLYTSLLIRLVLDHAKNLKDAERLIRETPWKDTPLLTKGGFQGHWLVATSEGSFVCEFINGEPTFTYAASPTSADYGNIMTNFSNYLMANYGTVQSHGCGYERFNLLKSHYESATPEELARLVFYSKMYSEEYTKPDYFWTEWASDEYPAAQLMTWRDNPSTRNGELWDKFVVMYNNARANYDWTVLGYDINRTRGSWYTAHSSIWDIANKTLVLDIEEQNKFSVKFNLDGTFSIQ